MAPSNSDNNLDNFHDMATALPVQEDSASETKRPTEKPQHNPGEVIMNLPMQLTIRPKPPTPKSMEERHWARLVTELEGIKTRLHNALVKLNDLREVYNFLPENLRNSGELDPQWRLICYGAFPGEGAPPTVLGVLLDVVRDMTQVADLRAKDGELIGMETRVDCGEEFLGMAEDNLKKVEDAVNAHLLVDMLSWPPEKLVEGLNTDRMVG